MTARRPLPLGPFAVYHRERGVLVGADDVGGIHENARSIQGALA